jgi:hypothetical protein
MSHTTTVELTRAEVGILYWGAMKEQGWHQDMMNHGESHGWYDGKTKERVTVRLHHVTEVVNKLAQVIKEMDA